MSIDPNGHVYAGTRKGFFALPDALDVAPTADIRVSLDSASVSTSLDLSSGKRNTMESFEITISNAGPFDASGTEITLSEVEGVIDMTWQCSNSENCSPASGVGVVSTLVDLAAGETLIISISAEVDPEAAFIGLGVSAVPPSGFVAVGGETRSSYSAPANNIGIFRSRFSR